MDVTESAVTTYKIQQNTTPRTTTVIQPNGTLSRQFSYNTPGQFTDGLVYQDESYIPDPNGITIPNVSGTFKLVGRSNVTWTAGEYDSPRPSYAEIWDENNQKVSTQYDHTGGRFNQITRSPVIMTTATFCCGVRRQAMKTRRHISDNFIPAFGKRVSTFLTW